MGDFVKYVVLWSDQEIGINYQMLNFILRAIASLFQYGSIYVQYMYSMYMHVCVVIVIVICIA